MGEAADGTRDSGRPLSDVAEQLIARGATSVDVAALMAPSMDRMTLAARVGYLLDARADDEAVLD